MQAKEHKVSSAEHVREMLQAKPGAAML